MLDPSLLAGTPFKSGTAFLDLIGTLTLMYGQIMQGAIVNAIIAGSTFPTRVTLDAGEPHADLLSAIHNQHVSLARALGIDAPPDLQSFDLNDPTDFAAWTFLLSADLTRLRDAAGVV
jgi:hypothetical protein